MIKICFIIFVFVYMFLVMRKFIISSVFCFLSATFAINAQNSYPDIPSLYDIGVQRTVFDESYVELDYLLYDSRWFFENQEDVDFLNLFGIIQTDNDAIIQRELVAFLEKHPNSFNREKASLLLGLFYLKNKEFGKSLYCFDRIEKASLDRDDVSRYYLAYALAKSYTNAVELRKKGSTTNLEVNKLLEDAINTDGRYSEDALFAMSILKWIENDRRTAYNIMRDTKFSKKLTPRALYWSKVMAFDFTGREKALSDALQYLSTNNDPNIELKRSVGITYYNMRDYRNSAKYLSQAYSNGKMDYDAMYAYASTMCELKDYDRAIDVLKDMESRSTDSDMLLASCYLRTGDLPKAVSIYSYIIPKTDKNSRTAQTAIYNSALAQNRIGSSSFGESVRLASEFLNRYPESNRLKVMSDLLSKAFVDSKNYEESLNQIGKIAHPTPDILKAKQYILVKMSNSIHDESKYWNKKQLLLEALKLKNISPYYKEALFSLASNELKEEQYANAIKYSNEAIALDGGLSWHNGLIHYVKGYALFNSKEYPSAYNSFASFVQSNGSDKSFIEDAYIRMGDCMYQGKTNLDRAVELYNKADEISPGSEKALMRIVNIHATKGEFAKEIKVLDDLLGRTKDNNIKPELMYKKAKALVLNGDIAKSNSVFESIISEYPDSEYARLSMLENAMAYYNNGNKDKAIYNYKNIINKYPGSIEASQAISDLKSIYMANGNIEEFISYTKGLGGKFDIDDNEQIRLMFSQAENYYQNGDKAKAKASLSKYIETYPSSPYTTKAKSYLADILYLDGDIDKSMSLYKDIEGDNSYTDIRQKTLIRLASIYSKKGDNKEAAQRYVSLLGTLESKDDKRKVILPALKALSSSGGHRKIDSLMQKTDKNIFDESSKNESYLIWAKSLVSMGEKKKALDVLIQLKNKNIDTPTGAESYVLQDQLRFDLNETAVAKKSIEKFIKESTSQQYWLARAFILLSDIYKKQGDRSTARQYLESLKHGYTDADKEIKDLIEEKLKQL